MDAGSTELRQRVVAALTVLTRAVEGQSPASAFISAFARKLTYTTAGASISSVLRDELTRKLRESQEFRPLHEFVMSNTVLLSVLLHKDLAKDKLNSKHLLVLGIYVEAALARLLLLIRHRDRSEPETKLVDQFLSFLSLGQVNRRVSIPINHLDAREPELDLGKCGKLFSTHVTLDREHPQTALFELASLPTCQLVFEIETGKFENARLAKISDSLRLRIALVRFVVQPLALLFSP
jgi:hypothetical protein